jgi:excisionase family DNA binding protein
VASRGGGPSWVTLSQLVEVRPIFTERHVRRLVAEKRVPFYKAGGRLVFDLDEIDEWIAGTRHAVVPSLAWPHPARRAGSRR